MNNIFKGILIGIGKILPGVSGSLIAISLGVYEKSINIIGNPFKIKKDDFIYLFNLSLGIIFSIFFLSNIIIYFLNNFYMQTMFIFIGLITGCLNGLIKIAKKETSFSNFILLLIPLLIFLLMYNIKFNLFLSINIISLFVLGLLESVTMIIPGISGTALFMYLGVYNNILKLLSSFNPLVIIFIIGIIIGFILLSNILSKLINKYKTKIIYITIGFTISTLLIILKNSLNCDYNIVQLFISTVLFIIGYIITMNHEII